MPDVTTLQDGDHAPDNSKKQSHPWLSEKGYLDIDTAIIGAGASGLYCAMRLAEERPDQKTCLFDTQFRCGGRVFTFKSDNLPFTADIGAMRYLPHQALISSLRRHFRLKEYKHIFPTWSFFVRGRDIRPPSFSTTETQELQERPLHHTGNTDAYVAQTAYRDLNDDEKHLQPAELIALGISNVLRECEISGDYLTAENDLVAKAGSRKVVMDAIKAAASKRHHISYADLDPYQWRVFKMYATDKDGKLLYKLGFWDVVQKGLSAEAFKFIEDGLGYHTIIGTWNAAEAIPWFLADFSGSTYESITGGMAELLNEMLQRFLDISARNHKKDSIIDSQLCMLGWCLYRVDRQQATSNDHVFEMHFTESQVETVNDHDSLGNPVKRRVLKQVTRLVRAKNIILASSKGAIENMHFEGFIFDENETKESARVSFKRALQCVSAHPLLKTFMWFRTPWWYDHSSERDLLESANLCLRSDSTKLPATVSQTDSETPRFEFANGRVFTDLPLRMIYYHGPLSSSCLSKGIEPRLSMIMAYCDARHAEYWESLNALAEARYQDKEFVERCGGEAVDNQLLEEFGVTQTFAERMHDQLWRFHRYNCQLNQREQSLFAVFMNWAKPPYFGGWHTWKIDYSAARWQQKMMKPFIGSRLFICGEAFSTDQGWIEGALKTAETLLNSHLGLTHAKWEGLEQHVKTYRYKSVSDYVRM